MEREIGRERDKRGEKRRGTERESENQRVVVREIWI